LLYRPKEKPKKLEIISDINNQSCATFKIREEDHTLGGALRYCLMKNKNVEFAGYSIPHPSEDILNFRVQTTGIPSTEAMIQSLDDLINISDYLMDVFNSQVDIYIENMINSQS